MERLKFLVTGGTGFFGKSLLRHYLSNEFVSSSEIVVLSRNPYLFLASYPEFIGHSSITFLQGDILQRDSLPWSHSFTHVLHAATESTIGPSLTPLQRYDQIVDGTRNILDLAVATGASRFLLTSSGAIYGSQPADLAAIPEDWPGSPPLAEPGMAYGQGKRAAEHLCALFSEQHGIETVIARCFAFVGADLPLNVHFAVGNFIRDAFTSDAITVYGDGTPLRTYLHQSDLAHWLFTLLEHGRPGQAYNVGSDEVISIAALAHLVRDILAPDKNVRILGQLEPGFARNHYVPSIIKIQRQLGLHVSVALTESIERINANIQYTGG
ncbi:NAD(P)-dependent oxidoreductase [Synechococcus sp. UW140]|uniref:NAD-dependent epimerase/dehydratase family protein n=1 Tax=Synechococcus sp. UW140 TaxID=368503 RepID=UPI003137D518